MRIRGQGDIEGFVADSGCICVKQHDAVDGDKVIEFAPAKFDRAAPVED